MAYVTFRLLCNVDNVCNRIMSGDAKKHTSNIFDISLLTIAMSHLKLVGLYVGWQLMKVCSFAKPSVFERVVT